MSRRDTVFHVALAVEWADAQRSGEYRPASLAREGFIHCSADAQLLATLRRHFSGQSDLVLLEVEVEPLGAKLRYEAPVPALPEEPDARFPHLYGALSTSAVRRAHVLPPAADGRRTELVSRILEAASEAPR